MPEIEILAVLVATAAAFVLGGTYYAMFGERLAEVSEAAAAGQDMPPWTLAVEAIRCLVLALVVAGLASQGQIDAPAGGLVLGLCLWIGFPLVLFTGAVVHEKTPWKLAAIHLGDWLVKLIVVGLVASAWQ
jgi:Protein of unknown function (DUF1761)